MKKLHCIILLWALLLNLCSASVYAEGNKLLAEKIINDQRLDQVERMAKTVISQGLNAGSGYSQIWARQCAKRFGTLKRVGWHTCQGNSHASPVGKIELLKIIRTQIIT